MARSDHGLALSGRTLPAWITGLAFVSANLGATEILGMGANGAQYGVATVNYCWIGAVPAMVFLGLVMMPFYYGARVRSVPEYLLMRFEKRSHIFDSYTFALATVLIAGVNLLALSLVLKLLLGWPILVGIVDDRDRADRVGLPEPDELPAGAVLDLQSAAVRHG